MAYKDKDKQREADRVRQQRRRDVIKSEGVTNTGCDGQGVTEPKHSYIGAVPETPDTTSPKRGKDIKCFADLPPDVQETIDKMSESNEEKVKRTAAAIKYQHLFPDRYDNRGMPAQLTAVTGKPGDADYNGICTPEWMRERGRGGA